MPTRCDQQLPLAKQIISTHLSVGIEGLRCVGSASVALQRLDLPKHRNPLLLAFRPPQDPFSLLPGHPLLALACEGHAALLAKVLDNGGNADAQDSRGLTGAAWQPQVQGGKCTAGAVLVCGLVLQEWR